MNVFEDRIGSWNVSVSKIFADRQEIEPPIHTRMLEYCLQFGGENQLATAQAVVKRFDTHPIARQEQPPFIPIPDREGKHPVKLLHCVYTVSGVLLQNYFGVRASPKDTFATFQVGAQFQVIINLAVIDNFVATVATCHRLAAAKQVNNTQPSTPHRDTFP